MDDVDAMLFSLAHRIEKRVGYGERFDRAYDYTVERYIRILRAKILRLQAEYDELNTAYCEMMGPPRDRWGTNV